MTDEQLAISAEVIAANLAFHVRNYQDVLPADVQRDLEDAVWLLTQQPAGPPQATAPQGELPDGTRVGLLRMAGHVIGRRDGGYVVQPDDTDDPGEAYWVTARPDGPLLVLPPLPETETHRHGPEYDRVGDGEPTGWCRCGDPAPCTPATRAVQRALRARAEAEAAAEAAKHGRTPSLGERLRARLNGLRTS